MKKLLKSAFIIFFAIVLTFSFVACQGGSFLTESQIKSLGNQLGLSKNNEDNFVNPTATIVLSFENNDNDYVVELTYELLFDKAPLTVNNFIALAKDGFYDNTVVSFTNSDYSLFGLYQLNNELQYEEKTSDFSIKGEFAANGWFVNGADKEDNAQHQLGCLGMYHLEQTKTENFYDSASTAFYMMWATDYSSTKTLSNDNYAVFAYIVSSKVKINDNTGGYYNGNGTSAGMDSHFVDIMKSLNTITKTDTNSNSLSKVPTNAITVTSITISGAEGTANTSYRK